MKEAFRAFLEDRGITESEYATFPSGDRVSLVTSFEKSVEGNSFYAFPNNSHNHLIPSAIVTLTCYLSMNHLLAQALHLLQDLLCIESYVFMSPFYCPNYQSILFCVGTVIKFLSHNDVCVCLSIVLYLLILTYNLLRAD